VQDDDGARFIPAIRQLSQLTELCVTGDRQRADDFGMLRIPTLQVLHLSGVPVTPDVARARALRGCSVTRLEVEYLYPANAGTYAVLLPQVTRLSCGIGSASDFQFLVSYRSVTDLRINIFANLCDDNKDNDNDNNDYYDDDDEAAYADANDDGDDDAAADHDGGGGGLQRLSELALLSRLHLKLSGSGSLSDDVLVLGLQGCSRLVHLTLQYVDGLTDQGLKRLVAELPSLRLLALVNVGPPTTPGGRWEASNTVALRSGGPAPWQLGRLQIRDS